MAGVADGLSLNCLWRKRPCWNQKRQDSVYGVCAILDKGCVGTVDLCGEARHVFFLLRNLGPGYLINRCSFSLRDAGLACAGTVVKRARALPTGTAQ